MEPSSQQFESDLPTLGGGPLPPGLDAITDDGRFDSNHYLLNAVSDGVLALDSESRIHYANSTACRLLGYTRDDLSGHPVRDIIADTLSPDVTPQQLYDPGLTSGELVSTDTARFRRSDGSLIQVMLTAIPVTDAGGNEADASADAAVFRTLSRFVDSALAAPAAPEENKDARNTNDSAQSGETNAAITGLLIVFRDVTPGLYLSLGRINQLLTRLMTQQGARSTIEAALGGVAEIVQADFAVLGVYEPENETVFFDTYHAGESFAERTRGEDPEQATAARSEADSSLTLPLRVPANETPYSYIYHNRKPIRINEYESHSLARPEFLRHGAVSLLATPVLAESRLMGVVYFFRTQRERPFSDADLENVRALGPVLSAAYFKADNETRLTELATTDPLTGLLNRRVIFDKIHSEIDRVQRYDSAFSALMLDLDLFKEINDAYGHLAGDRVLGEIARSLRANTRSADAVARTGGEEFLILLPQTPIEGALRTAEKIRDRIAELRIEAPAESDSANPSKSQSPNPDQKRTRTRERISVTASIGCACYQAGESRDEFYARLDHLLYQSKRAGRNRITS